MKKYTHTLLRISENVFSWIIMIITWIIKIIIWFGVIILIAHFFTQNGK